LLVGRTSEELATLEERTKVLSEAGIHAEFLSASSLHALEPALSVEKDGGAMFLPQDCQIDAFQAVSLIEKVSFLLQTIADFVLTYMLLHCLTGISWLTFSYVRPITHIPQKEGIWRSIMILPCH